MYLTFQKNMRAIILTTICVSGLLGCDDSDSKTPSPIENETDSGGLSTDDSDGLSVDGIWQSQGYGMVMGIDGDTAEIYEISDIHCLKVDSVELEAYETPELAEEGSQLILTPKGSVTRYRYDRLSEMPALCADGGTASSDDELSNFDILWQTFEEHYAFFDLREVDWDAAKKTYRGQVGDRDLFDIFVDMLAPLKDGHVILVNDQRYYSPSHAVVASRFPHIIKEFDEQTEIEDGEEYFFSVVSECAGIVPYNYLAPQTIGMAANDQVLWGVLRDHADIGYLSVYSMSGLCEECSVQGEVDAAESAMDEAMADLATVDTLIVDVRFNTGGSDAVALTIAEYFIDGPRIGFTKRAVSGDGFTEEQIIEMAGDRDNRYPGDVVLLISPLTVSAGEVFCLMMKNFPSVQHILGETTWGIFSDMLLKTLPNGWNFSLSNEIYRDADGTVFEGVGISPDETITSFTKEERDNQVDTMLERVIEIAGK